MIMTDIIIYFFRDTLSGFYYFVYVAICLFFFFAIIGYLCKLKYGKIPPKLIINSKGTTDFSLNLEQEALALRKTKEVEKEKKVTENSIPEINNNQTINNQ